jgi:membrane protease subunit (stomatin/prohibitin family)
VSFIDKIRAELIDIVEWIDDSRHTLVWRFPRYHNQIKNGAKLIVRPGQEAIFVHQGKVADVFKPGTYTLSTKNLPVLSTLAGWPHGFDSPFKAEVYFVATRQITDLKWGTPNPVPMRDPDFGPIRVRAFGTYSLRAVDSRALLTELVGTDSAFETEEISEFLRSIINTAFADLVASAEMAVLDLASNYQQLGEKLRQTVVTRIDDEFGLDIPQFYIVNISLPAEVERALDKRTSMSVIGDMAWYQQYQMGQAMPIAAANPAGGLAGAGVGVGMGLAMANQMGGFPGGGGQPGAAPQPGGGAAPTTQVTPPPLPAVPGAATWHIVEGGQVVGPFTLAQLGEAVAMGRLKPDTYVWNTGMTSWVRAGEIRQVAALFSAGPPPPPPPAE